jgi:hypothetical protein
VEARAAAVPLAPPPPPEDFTPFDLIMKMIGKPGGDATERLIFGVSDTKELDAKIPQNGKSSGLALSSHQELCCLLYYLR